MSSAGQVGSCPVAEVMGTEMFTVTPDTAVSSARRLVLENDVRHMLVLDQGTLAGIVCSEDLRFADRDACIGDCMTSPVLCITPDTTLQEAIDIMSANDVDCLPVVTGLFLIGIVTLEGLATANLAPRNEWLQGAEDADLPATALDADAESSAAPAACDACAGVQGVSALTANGGEEPGLLLCARCHGSLRASLPC